ncbi:solute carrier organic anion transporter family member 2A1-like [Octopus sinensis]|uniref:Solute carrier organic anion transporter family member 2A1-like n=1 Tax=Octopus sinensis TaxID=2607531 RepID=A0A6P7S859_9MOLL|nr:solute carrier organic anion transporter family member 2A1-like [Octopus sinensis]
MTESNPADDNQFQVEIISPQPEKKCFNLKSFAVIVGFANLLIYSVSSYLGSQITTIEKQFNLASSDSGLLMSGNDIGFLVASLFLTYLLKDTHRPKLLGISGVLSGLACMICSLPHFVTPKPNAETSSNISVIIVEKELSYCERSMNANETCVQNEVDETTYSKNIAFGIILMSTFVIGVCKSPRTALTTAYIDDNTESVYTNAYISWLPAPPAFGYVVDSSCKTWSKFACDQKGACKEYDMDTFRYRFFLLQCGLNSLAFLLKFLAAVIGLKSKRYFTEEKSETNSAN